MYEKLKSKIKEVCGTDLAFAESMGMTRSALSHKLRGERGWSTDQLWRAMDVLRITPEEVVDMFLREEDE